MVLCFVRHGESLANVDHDIYNKIPDHRIPMTDKGKAQAESVGIDLSQRGPLHFYVSPYVRTRETFEIIKNHLAAMDILALVYSPSLREQEYEFFEDQDYRTKVMADRDTYGKFFYKFKNGESVADVYDRVLSFLNFLLKSHAKSDTVVIVAHEVVIRCFLMITDGTRPEDSFVTVENGKPIWRTL